MLLGRLNAAERHRLLADADLVDLESSHVVGSAGRPLSHAYFPTTAIITLLTPRLETSHLGVGAIGFEGVFGGAGAMGIAISVFDAVVTAGGQAWRIDVGKLARHVRRSARLTAMILRFVFVEVSQIGAMATCSRFHTLRQRLSRCLLTTQDRLRSSDLFLTHDALSNILGVRRAGVSVAAAELQSLNMIRYTRGHIVVLDRAGLLSTTCSCYEQERVNYDLIMGESGS